MKEIKLKLAILLLFNILVVILPAVVSQQYPNEQQPPPVRPVRRRNPGNLNQNQQRNQNRRNPNQEQYGNYDSQSPAHQPQYGNYNPQQPANQPQYGDYNQQTSVNQQHYRENNAQSSQQGNYNGGGYKPAPARTELDLRTLRVYEPSMGYATQQAIKTIQGRRVRIFYGMNNDILGYNDEPDEFIMPTRIEESYVMYNYPEARIHITDDKRVNRVADELIRYYSVLKNNILNKYDAFGDYGYYCDKIQNDLESLKESLYSEDAGKFFLKKRKFIISNQRSGAVLEGLNSIKTKLEGELEKCSNIVKNYNEGYWSEPYYPKTALDNKKVTDDGVLISIGNGDTNKDIMDRRAIFELEEMSGKKPIEKSSCDGDIFTVEAEVLTITSVQDEIQKKCNGRPIRTIKMFAFSEVIFDTDPMRANQVIIIAPKFSILFSHKFLRMEGADHITIIHMPEISSGQYQSQGKYYNFDQKQYFVHNVPSNEHDESNYHDIVVHINEYKDKLIQSIQYVFVARKLEFYDRINELDIHQGVRTEVLYDDFLKLMKGNSKIKITEDNPNIIRVYKSMLSQITFKINEFHNNNDDSGDEVKLLKYLSSAVASRMYNIQDNLDKSFVVDISVYTDVIKTRIKQLDTINYVNTIVDMNKEYNDLINEKIKEGVSYADNHLKKQISDVQDDIMAKLKNEILPQIEKMKTQVQEDISGLKKKLALTIITGVLGVLGSICTILGGPVGVGLGLLFNAGSAVIGAVNTYEAKAKIPPALETSMSKIGGFIDNYDEDQDKIVKKMKDVAEEGGLNLKDDAMLGFKFLNETGNKVADALKLVEEAQKNEKYARHATTLKRMNKIGTVASNALAIGADACVTISESAGIYGEIEAKENDLKNLGKLSKLISNKMVPFLKDVKAKLQKEVDNFQNEKPIGLDIKQWKISELIGDLRDQLTLLTTGFTAASEIVDSVNKLDKYFDILIKIYQRIQGYKEHKESTEYITQLQDPKHLYKRSVSVFATKQLYLETIVKKDVLIKNYNKIIESIKQYGFPYEYLFLKNVMDEKLYSDLELKQLIEQAENNLDEIKRNINIVASTNIPNYHPFVKQSPFYSKPFYTWEYKDNQKMFDDLLLGKAVVVTSSQPDNLKKKDAIKFITLTVELKTKDSRLQRDLENMSGLIVDIKHMGDSHYTCNNKEFIVDSTEYEMQCNYGTTAMKCEDCCTLSANMYRHSGYPQLSPYATFSIQFKNEFDEQQVDLTRFNSTDLSMVLVGNGQYIMKNKDNDVCVNSYYDSYDILPN